MSGLSHIPVMLGEVLEALGPMAGRQMVDGTFGGGGYSIAMLERGARVAGFDRDPRAIAAARPLAEQHAGLSLHNLTFASMAEELGTASVDGVALDLGYSSIQMDDPAYGLSFQQDGPLDMRLSGSGMSAADFINSAPEAELADILYLYGEERASRRIARAIVADRPFATTGELATLIRRIVRRPDQTGQKRDPATRSFQAIRIHVNDELGELERGLEAAEQVLKPGGCLAVVSFHSLEDRIVKRFLAERSGRLSGQSRHLPMASDSSRPIPSFARPDRARHPQPAEISANPRARSATLRVARRSTAPAWGRRHQSDKTGEQTALGQIASGHRADMWSRQNGRDGHRGGQTGKEQMAWRG